MKVLVVGAGGREHALVWKLSQSPLVDKIYAGTGNAGTEALGENLECGVDVLNSLQDLVTVHQIDWTVVGPEAMLAEGIVDQFQRVGLKIYGPSRYATQLESSKSFAKSFMHRHGIPTARFATFENTTDAIHHIESVGYEVVVKADGLAAGKGVVVPDTRAEAITAVRSMLEDEVFGRSGSSIVLEEKLVGDEATLLCFCDGKTLLPMVTSQDHKRALDGDKGPNTGGMGVYAPTPLVTPELMEKIRSTILDPTMAGLIEDGIDYRGILYVGLMITSAGEPYVIEYNARFGDPEAQVVLSLLETDLMEIILATEEQRLGELDIRWKNQAACCVVLASGGYPNAYKTGYPITGLDKVQDVMVFHAGTDLVESRVVTDGGRVLGVTAVADTFAAAREIAYREIKKIHFEGMQYRTDIGARAEGYSK